MKNMLLISAGFYNLAFVGFHLSFWRLLHWKSELLRLTPVNRAVMQVLNLRLTYLLLVVGCAVFVFLESLCRTDLGRFILVSMAIFWLMRAIEQVVFFGLKGAVSKSFVVVFLIGAAIFVAPVLI